MSVEARRWAWRQRGLNASAHLLLLRLADLCKQDTCYRSDAELVADTGMSDATIGRRRAELVKAGLVSIDSRRQHLPTMYKLLIQTGHNDLSDDEIQIGHCDNSDGGPDRSDCAVCDDIQTGQSAIQTGQSAPQIGQHDLSTPYNKPEEPDQPEEDVAEAPTSSASAEPELPNSTPTKRSDVAQSILVAFEDAGQPVVRSTWGRCKKHLNDLIEAFGVDQVQTAFAPEKVLAALDRGVYPFDKGFSGIWSHHVVAFEELTKAEKRAATRRQESTPCQTENAWATLPMPGATSQPSSAEMVTATP